MTHPTAKVSEQVNKKGPSHTNVILKRLTSYIDHIATKSPAVAPEMLLPFAESIINTRSFCYLVTFLKFLS